MVDKFQIKLSSIDITFDPEHPNFEDEYLVLCETIKNLQLKQAERIEA